MDVLRVGCVGLAIRFGVGLGYCGLVYCVALGLAAVFLVRLVVG